MGGLHLVLEGAAQGTSLCALVDAQMSVLCVTDVPGVHAVQGDPAQVDRIEATGAVSEPCVADGRAPASTGRVRAHPGCARRT